MIRGTTKGSYFGPMVLGSKFSEHPPSRHALPLAAGSHPATAVPRGACVWMPQHRGLLHQGPAPHQAPTVCPILRRGSSHPLSVRLDYYTYYTLATFCYSILLVNI